MSQDFSGAAKVYGQLVKYYPSVEEYKIYHAQSLYKEGLYDDSLRTCQTIESENYFP